MFVQHTNSSSTLENIPRQIGFNLIGWVKDLHSSFPNPCMVVHILPVLEEGCRQKDSRLDAKLGYTERSKPPGCEVSPSYSFSPRPQCLCLGVPELMPEGHWFRGWLVLIITSNWAPSNFQRHSCETSKSLSAPARGGKQHEANLWTWSWPAETTENWGKGWEVMKYAEKGLPIAKLTVKLEAWRTTMEENQSTFSNH